MILLALLLLASADELYKRGTDAFARGQTEEAVRLLTQAATENSKSAQTWKALGVAYAASGNHEAATEPFRRACSLDTSLLDVCYYLGRNLYAQNQFQPALEALKRAPKNSRVTLAIAQAHEALGKAAEAETAFRNAMREHSGGASADFDPQLHYAVFLYRQGRIREALPAAEAAQARYPQSGRAHFELGRIQLSLGELDKAAASLEQAVRLRYGAAAHLLLGKVYMRLGRTDAAQEHLKAGAAEQAP